MRSTRMLLATAAASAVFVLGAPGAYAAAGYDHDDSSYGEEWSKESDGDGRHDVPRGGMHTGGGALSSVTRSQIADDGREKPESWTTEKKEERDWGMKEESGLWGGDHEKPRGGMHTGGGALAARSLTAGELAVIAFIGTVLYTARRRKTAASVA